MMKILNIAKFAKMAINQPTEDNALIVLDLTAKNAKSETLYNAKIVQMAIK